MLKLFRLVFGIVSIAAVAYVTFMVQFGEKTLYEHFRSISKTDEAQQLESEIKKKAKTTVQTISSEIKVKAVELTGEDDDSPAAQNEPHPTETETKVVGRSRDDRAELKELIKNYDELEQSDREALRNLVRKKINKNIE